MLYKTESVYLLTCLFTLRTYYLLTYLPNDGSMPHYVMPVDIFYLFLLLNNKISCNHSHDVNNR